jgi:dienelactone hydrolase
MMLFSFQKILILSLSLFIAGCISTKNIKKIDVTSAISEKLLFELNSQDVVKIISQYGVENTLKVYGLRVYEIPYISKDANNHKIRLSGILSVPVNKAGSLALVSFSHGTKTINDIVPTMKAKRTKQPSIAALFFSATAGFATIEADYIGYGISKNSYHPYMVKDASANTTIDFINAVKKFAKDNGIKLNNHLYLTGYSEGGFVAMAALQKLEQEHIKVDAAAPIAGAYDLNYMARAVLGWENEPLKSYAMTYTILTLNAYAKKYGKDIKTIIKEPYASKINLLLDGKHSFKEIHSALPVDEVGKNGLLREEFLQSYKSDPNHWIEKAFRENSVYNWKPRTKLALVHCKGDDQVPYTISLRTLQSFLRHNAKDVRLITLDNLEKDDKKWNHLQCFMPGMFWVADWFKTIQENIEFQEKIITSNRGSL